MGQPYKCPICNGEREWSKVVIDTDKISNDLDLYMQAGSVAPLKSITFPCKSCDETGVVWSKDKDGNNSWCAQIPEEL